MPFELRDIDKKETITLSVQNATDETYQEWELINPAPGRLVAVEAGANVW